MTLASTTVSFLGTSYRLSSAVELSSFAQFEAGQAGVICAGMDPWARYRMTAPELAAFFAQAEPGAPRFAIRVNGRLEGALVVRTNWLAGPYIQLLALAPNAQGQKIGSLVMDFVEGQARKTTARNLWVAASDFNAAALRFYERHGFVRIAEIDALLRNDRNEALLRKKLFASGFSIS
ncbi:MAG: GNAT family N-acetyltransferase [Hyphomicrobiaceae bacterium]